MQIVRIIHFMKRIGTFRFPKDSYMSQSKESIHVHLRYKNFPCQAQQIHTSQTRCINPILVAILRPLGKLTAVLVGRGFRKWWLSLPKHKQRLFLSHIARNKWRYVGVLGVMGVGGYKYSLTHVKGTPLTDRKRFVLFDTSELHEISQAQFNETLQANKDFLLPQDHPHVMRVKNVAMKLLRSNKELPQVFSKFWTITVIDVAEENCFVFPTGQIVMFSGMLNLLENDDQLAVILAHEMSHAILEHSAELQSYGPLLDFMKIFPIALIWAFMPSDLAAGVVHYIFNFVSKLLLELPYSRRLEEEADVVGLFLMASACYDVREASALWGQLHLMDTVGGKLDPFTWFSTHPSHTHRQSILDALMEAAISTRNHRKCSSLKKIDPRLSIALAQKRHNLTKETDADECCSDKNKVFSEFTAVIENFNHTRSL